MDIKQTKRNDTYSIEFSIFEEGTKIAWAFLVVIRNERHDEPYSIMENVYVEKEHRGKGIGTKLVNAVIDKARELGCYKLLAQSRYGKDGVHNLYTRFGFKDHGKNFRMDFFDSKLNQRD